MLIKEQRLPLTHHAEHAVIHQKDDNRHVVGYGSGEFVEAHAEAAVARDEHAALACADRRTDGRTEAEAHGAEAAAGNEAARLFKVHVLRRPHLVLADVRCNGGILAEMLVQRHDRVAGRKARANIEIIVFGFF